MDKLILELDMSNVSEETQENLMKTLNELKNEILRKTKRTGKPKVGEEYFYIDSYGQVLRSKWSNDIWDEYRYGIGNVFFTSEDAEFEVERRKVLTELQRYADEHNEYEIDWNNRKQEKWIITYDVDGLYFLYDYGCRDMGNIHFSSEEIAKQAVKKVGEYRIKKYLFRVEDET